MHQRGLTIFRVIICLIVIKNMCFYLPMADELFGAHSIFPFESYVVLMDYYGLHHLTYPFNTLFFPQLYLLAVIVFATTYMLGVGGRIMGVLLYLSIIILKIRNGFILDGSDNVIQVTLPFLILADNLSYFRLFKIETTRNSFLNKVSSIPSYGLMIQICFVYFFTGLAKLQGELWLNGTAIYYTMRVSDFMATSWNIALTENHYFVVIGTYFTVLFEMAFPFLIWFRQSKFYIIFGGILLHVGIWIFMRIDNFSWVMITSYFVFITDKEYEAIWTWLKSNRLSIFIDSWCPNCKRFGTTIKAIDMLGIVEVKDIRVFTSNFEDGLDIERGKKVMASKNSMGTYYYGFESLYEISKRIPVLWIIFPMALIFKFTKLGNLLYNELAVRRNIIPIHCSDDCNLQ